MAGLVPEPYLSVWDEVAGENPLNLKYVRTRDGRPAPAGPPEAMGRQFCPNVGHFCRLIGPLAREPQFRRAWGDAAAFGYQTTPR